MNTKIVKYLIVFLCIAIGYEISNLALILMNQPDTYLFWAGLFIIFAEILLVALWLGPKIKSTIEQKNLGSEDQTKENS